MPKIERDYFTGKLGGKMLEYLDKEEKKEFQTSENFVQKINQKLVKIQNKLDKLLEGYLNGFIEEEDYKRKKEELIQQKSP